MKTTHLHHIIPKHMGGSDDPSNLIELTIEEHAEAHRKLWEEHGKREDYLAWKGLAGLIGREELLAEVNKLKGKSWDIGFTEAREIHYTSEQLKAHGKWLAEEYGKKNLTKEHQRKAGRAAVLKKKETNWVSPFKGKLYELEEKERVYPSATCPTCGKTGNARGMKQWHGKDGEKCKQR